MRFAAHQAVQESLAFIPAELVFVTHLGGGALKVQKEKLLIPEESTETNVTKYVQSFRESLSQANTLGKKQLATPQ